MGITKGTTIFPMSFFLESTKKWGPRRAEPSASTQKTEPDGEFPCVLLLFHLRTTQVNWSKKPYLDIFAYLYSQYVCTYYIYKLYIVLYFPHPKIIHPKKTREKKEKLHFHLPPHSFLPNWAEPTGNVLLVFLCLQSPVEPKKATQGWWGRVVEGFSWKIRRNKMGWKMINQHLFSPKN